MRDILKKSELWGAVSVMILGTMLHFFYEWSGKNPIVALFALFYAGVILCYCIAY